MPQMMPIAWVYMSVTTMALVWTTVSVLFFLYSSTIKTNIPEKPQPKLTWPW